MSIVCAISSRLPSKTCTRTRSPSGVKSAAAISTVSDGRAIGRSLWTCRMRTRAATIKLEGQPRPDLNVARIVAVRGHETERGVARILVRSPQHGVIERVDGFDADLHAHAARQVE